MKLVNKNGLIGSQILMKNVLPPLKSHSETTNAKKNLLILQLLEFLSNNLLRLTNAPIAELPKQL